MKLRVEPLVLIFPACCSNCRYWDALMLMKKPDVAATGCRSKPRARLYHLFFQVRPDIESPDAIVSAGLRSG
jgi:hypothetical protein